MLYLFLLFIFISYIYEKNVIKCKKYTLKTELLSLLHHLISGYVFIGTFLFNFPVFNILFALALLLGWYLMEIKNGKSACILTVMYNKECGRPYEEPFYDGVRMLKVGKYKSVFLIFIIIYNLYFR